jgi:hypothetical protein
MRCMPDGHVKIMTIDGRSHLFRNGFWWCEEAREWVPWVGSMFGLGWRATRAELALRAAWLVEAEAVAALANELDLANGDAHPR